MNVECIERIPDLMGDAGRQQGQSLNPLALDRFEGPLPGFGSIVQNQRHSGTAGSLAIQRRSIKPQKARAREMNFEFVAHHALSAFSIETSYFFPSQLGNEISDRLPLDIRLQTEQARDRLIEIENSPGFIHHQNAILDSIEEGLQKAALARELLHDVLQSFGIQPSDTPQNLIQEIRFAGHTLRCNDVIHVTL